MSVNTDSENNKQESVFNSFFWTFFERYFSQIIHVGISILLARILMPSDYGIISMLSLFMAVAQLLVDSGLSSALIQKQNRTQVDLSTIFYFNIIISSLLYLILVLLSPAISSFYNQPILKEIMKWSCFVLVINSFSCIQRTVLSISFKFKKQAFITIISGIISGTIAVVLAYNGFGVWTLVAQSLLNSFIYAVLIWLFTSWRPSFVFSLNSLVELGSYGFKLLGGGVLHILYTNINTLIIGKMYSAGQLGYYGKASSLSGLLTTNLTSIIEKSTFPHLCKIKDDTVLCDKFFLFLKVSSLVLFPLLCMVASVGKPLILILLTEKWTGCILYFQILCVAFMFDPIMRLTWNMLNVKGRTDYSLKSELIKKTIAFAILLISVQYGITYMCLGLLVYSIADLSVILFFTRKVYPRINHNNVFKVLFRSLVIAGIVSMGAYLPQFFTNHLAIQLFSGIIIGFLLWISMVYFFYNDSMRVLVGLIKKK